MTASCGSIQPEDTAHEFAVRRKPRPDLGPVSIRLAAALAAIASMGVRAAVATLLRGDSVALTQVAGAGDDDRQLAQVPTRSVSTRSGAGFEVLVDPYR